MSTPTRVEVDDIKWFAGYGPVELTGEECAHDCEHRGQSVIAWGPSLLHYELVDCDTCGCRSWQSALPGSGGGIRGSHPWLARISGSGE